MNLLNKVIRTILKCNKWLAQLVLIFMFLSVPVFVVCRMLGYPLLGSVEIIQFSMVLLIVGSLAYTEESNSHISIGLIVDRLPARVQRIVDLIARFLTLAFCGVISAAFLLKMEHTSTSDLLHLPFYPFRYAIILGFIAWGIVLIYKLLNIGNKIKTDPKEDGDVN